ncbi:hypothetical protein WISP_106036 [Willisornis vidua]|uniref:Uncharacterized protein n=1 Tax=Willisornis vidua TaxID=1566151 RepID=A0ABQ9D2Z5_9PASS|nr:hypothetical protein WISP_106036 [Willisornis vidua]
MIIFWKHGGQALHAKFHKLVVLCWEQGELPSDLHDSVIITLDKKKGEKSDCSNYQDGKIDKEIDNSLAKAYRAFRKLHKRVWPNKYLKKSTKISVYRAIVLSTLSYGSESWVIYCHHLRLLEWFHQRCLRSILNIHWYDYMTNVSVLEQAGDTSIEAMLMRTQLCWAGHVSRMENYRLPKIVLYGELATGHIDCHQWSTLASNWDSWRHTIHYAATSFENAHRISLKEKRQCRKNRSSPVSPKETFRYAFCDWTCLSRINLFSNQHACSKHG